MSVSLPPDLERFVEQQLAGGEYASENEILAEGLRLLRQQKTRRDQLRAEIQIGLDELNRGEGEPLDMDRVREKVAQRLSRSEEQP